MADLSDGGGGCGSGGGGGGGSGLTELQKLQIDIMPNAQTEEMQMQMQMCGRLALSQQSSRFELPIDLKILENMSPQEYLSEYCRITSAQRITLFKRTFKSHCDSTRHLKGKELEEALKGVLINIITQDDITMIFDLVQIDEESNIDFKLFCGLAALAERLLYHKFLTSETEGLREYQKDKIECADFCALEWKINGVDIKPPIRKLLETVSQ